MMIILDTNVLSEMTRLRPSSAVLAWLDTQRASRLYTTAITQAELLYGLRLLPKGRRRATLESVVSAILGSLDGRILAFGTEDAPAYARISSERRRAGRPLAHLDAQIAAIAARTGATLATRNTKDFEACGLALVDPWMA